VGFPPIEMCAAPLAATTLKTLDCTENADEVVAAPAVKLNEDPAPTGL
jgi:hypothetical protein